MRCLALLLVLLSPAAFANVPCYGGTVVYAPTVEDCPKRISDVSITPTVGGFDLGYTSEGGVTVEIAVEAGHDQKCPGCPYATGTSDLTERRINWARLDDQAIKNAAGMSLNSQQDASTAGNYSISITGLANSTDYSIHLLPIEADDSYGQAWQRNVTTLATAAPTNDEPEWYTGTGGNDLADCLTRATRCATAAPVLAAMDVGDDVAIEPATVWNEQLNITVSGSAADMSIWGTNYESGGADYWWWEGPTPRTVTQGEIKGSLTAACADAPATWTCDVGSYNGAQAGYAPIPSGIFAGLVDLGVGRHHVRVGGIAVHDSAARGIDMEAATNIVINDVDMDRVAHVGIMAEKGSKYVVYVRNYLNRATAGEQAEQEGRLPGDWIPQANIGTSSQPSCIKVCVNNHNSGWDSYCGAWGNTVRNCSGEAFGVAVNRHNWIEQNYTHDTSLSYYTDHSRNSYFVRNLAAGSGHGSQINQSGHATGAEGTAVNRGEGQGSINEMRVWNITVGTANGIGLRNIGSENVGVYDNWSVNYHNTIIRPIQGEGIIIGAASGIASVTADNDFRANVVWAGTAADMCRKDISIGTIDYQSWSGVGPSDPQCVGANDTTAALTWPHSAADYENITYEQGASTWTLADYKPTGANENAAPVIAVPAWATSDLASSEWDFIRQYDGEGYFMWGAAGCVVNVAASALMTGADCQGLDGTPDIGAVQ